MGSMHILYNTGSGNFGTFGSTARAGNRLPDENHDQILAPDGDQDRIPLLHKYHVCIPGCCTDHCKLHRMMNAIL